MRGGSVFRPTTPGTAPGPSLDDLRRKLIKFAVNDFAGKPAVTYTVSVPDSASGVQVLEKALEKARLLNPRTLDQYEYWLTETGGLVIDGWAAFVDWDDPDQYRKASALLKMDFC
jgi:mitogen-activated protein kinase kinase kinase